MDAEWVLRLAVVAVAAAVVVFISRRPITQATAWPSGVLAGPAIVFFSSRTCASCLDARATLDEIAAGRYREIGWEDDPDGWTEFGVESVPTAVLVDAHGRVTDDMVGPVDPKRLRRWLKKVERDDAEGHVSGA